MAERPILEHLDAFDARADVASAKAVDDLTSEEIYALGPGTLVKWTRKTGIDLGHERLLEPADPVAGAVLYVPTKGGKAVALAVTEDPETCTYCALHDNILLYGGLDLSYSCEAGSYCDEVSIVARVRLNRAGPPELDEGDSWPKAWKGYFMPTLDAVVLADRFDLWKFDAP